MTSIVRQVRFPLKLKLLAVMIILIAASLSVFVGIALKTFKEDKAAYIFETLLNKSSSGQVVLSEKLQGLQNPASFSLDQGRVKFGENTADELLAADLKKNQDGQFRVKIIVPHQNEFFEWSQNGAIPVSSDEKALLSSILRKSLHQVVKEIRINDEGWLYAYDYNPKLNFAYVVSLPQEKAFEVTKYLINKSLLYGLFILGVAMLLSVLLARPLTRQLEILFGMTQEIAAGNFTKRISIPAKDEVGALSDSVNDMADKIVIFMEEMKEKARLENEVAVAQLVQASFFPGSQRLMENKLAIQGHFEPATECGGDWWGVFEKDEWKVLFIADATGHGVPAALLTATINCCKTSLNFILETKPDLLSRPDEILRYMNQAVCGAGKEIQVTCFVASYHKSSGKFIYSNASHTPPLVFNGYNDSLTKDNFQPLIEANGPRLGQKVDSTYGSQTLSLRSGDTIFFYTDGLTEGENAEGARWGERRLIKALALAGKNSPEEILKGVLSEFKQFSPERPKDDLTAVVMKVLS